jgi:PAS domain S-box-containing protein
MESGAEQIARRAGVATARVYEALLAAHDHLNIGIGVTDGPRIAYANDALCRMYGYTAEELQALPSFLDIVIEDDRPRLADRLSARLQGTEASDVGSTTIVRKDGSHLEIEYAIGRIEEPAVGQGQSMITIVRDLTERREVEAQQGARIREQTQLLEAERFRGLIEHSYDVVALLDAQGQILYDSPAKTRVLGYVGDELYGTSAFALIHPDDIASVRETFMRLIGSPGGAEQATFRLRHKDGSWRWVDATGSNLLETPPVNAVVVNYRDVTDALEAAEVGYARARASYAVSNVILGAHTIEGAAVPILNAIGTQTGWEFGSLWLAAREDHHQGLRCAATWHAPGENFEEFEQVTRAWRPKPGEGFVGKAWSEGVFIYEPDLPQRRDSVQREAAVRAGLISAVTIPLRASGGVLGVIDFCGRRSRAPDEAVRETYMAMGDQVGQFVERAQIARLILEMSTPVLPIADRLLLIPLTGTFYPERASLFQSRLLGAIRSHRALVAVVDVTGVAVMDTYAASQLIQATHTARLLGCHLILSGVSADASRSLVTLGVDMRAVQTTRDVEQGLEIARRVLSHAAPGGGPPVLTQNGP